MSDIRIVNLGSEPGPPGDEGDTGPAGASAFTKVTLAAAVPLPSELGYPIDWQTVTIAVGDSRWMVPNTPVNLENFGLWYVVAKPSDTSVTLVPAAKTVMDLWEPSGTAIPVDTLIAPGGYADAESDITSTRIATTGTLSRHKEQVAYLTADEAAVTLPPLPIDGDRVYIKKTANSSAVVTVSAGDGMDIEGAVPSLALEHADGLDSTGLVWDESAGTWRILYYFNGGQFEGGNATGRLQSHYSGVVDTDSGPASPNLPGGPRDGALTFDGSGGFNVTGGTFFGRVSLTGVVYSPNGGELLTVQIVNSSDVVVDDLTRDYYTNATSDYPVPFAINKHATIPAGTGYRVRFTGAGGLMTSTFDLAMETV